MSRQIVETPEALREQMQTEVLDLIEREGGLFNGHVPLELINGRNVPVNKENLEVIGVQLDNESEKKGTDGQIQPIVLGMVEGFDKFEIIDGFHRYKKFESRGLDKIYATIKEVTHEELLDLRIQNTINHQGLQFARATQWVKDSWELNPYSDRIKASQAFTLGRTKSSTGKKLGLDAEEVTEIMEWVDGKSSLWGLAPITIYDYLNTNEKVASDLVHESRPNAEQSSSPNSLPPSTLKTIGKKIPGRDDLQRVVARVIIDNRLSSVGITSILADVENMSDEDAIGYLQTVDFAAYKERIAGEQVFKYPESEIVRLERIRESSRVKPLDEIATLTGIHVDMVLEDASVDKDVLRDIREAVAEVAKRLVAKVAEIDAHISEGDSGKTIDAQVGVQISVEEFGNKLKEFMLDHEKPIRITNYREARIAERTLDRGRGTRMALEKLQEEISRFYGQKDS